MFCYCTWNKKVSNTKTVLETISNFRKEGAFDVLEIVRFKEGERTHWQLARDEQARKKPFTQDVEPQYVYESYPGLILPSFYLWQPIEEWLHDFLKIL